MLIKPNPFSFMLLPKSPSSEKLDSGRWPCGAKAKLFTMCLKKFIRKVFQHMVATRFASWKELAIHDQDGLAYPIYNYVIEAADARLREVFAGYGLEIENPLAILFSSVGAVILFILLIVFTLLVLSDFVFLEMLTGSFSLPL